MANSTQKLIGNPIVALGYVNVPATGTPVPLSINIDPSNNNAPGTAYPPPPAWPGMQTEITPTMRGFVLWGFKPGPGNGTGNNGAMVSNVGNVYLLQAAAAGGSGNKSDTGAIVAIIGPGNSYSFPPEGFQGLRFSPYYLWIDTDANNEGALVTAYAGGG